MTSGPVGVCVYEKLCRTSRRAHNYTTDGASCGAHNSLRLLGPSSWRQGEEGSFSVRCCVFEFLLDFPEASVPLPRAISSLNF